MGTNGRMGFIAGVEAALDALAVSVTAARSEQGTDALLTGMQAAFADTVAAITRRAARHASQSLVRSGVSTTSPAAVAVLDSGRRSIDETVRSFYELLAGSVAVSTRLLESLAAATGRDPDDVLADIGRELHDA